jgi:DNA-binding NtrC family response regulator
LPISLMPYFANYRWPGNIRELENIVERLVVLTPGSEIALVHLPAFLRREHPSIDALNIDLPAQGISLEAIEKELIVKALEKFKFNQTHAAKYLDISRKALMYRMEKHGIQRPDTAHDEEEPEHAGE